MGRVRQRAGRARRGARLRARGRARMRELDSGSHRPASVPRRLASRARCAQRRLRAARCISRSNRGSPSRRRWGPIAGVDERLDGAPRLRRRCEPYGRTNRPVERCRRAGACPECDAANTHSPIEAWIAPPCVGQLRVVEQVVVDPDPRHHPSASCCAASSTAACNASISCAGFGVGELRRGLELAAEVLAGPRESGVAVAHPELAEQDEHLAQRGLRWLGWLGLVLLAGERRQLGLGGRGWGCADGRGRGGARPLAARGRRLRLISVRCGW